MKGKPRHTEDSLHIAVAHTGAKATLNHKALCVFVEYWPHTTTHNTTGAVCDTALDRHSAIYCADEHREVCTKNCVPKVCVGTCNLPQEETCHNFSMWVNMVKGFGQQTFQKKGICPSRKMTYLGSYKSGTCDVHTCTCTCTFGSITAGPHLWCIVFLFWSTAW